MFKCLLPLLAAEGKIHFVVDIRAEQMSIEMFICSARIW